MSKKEKDTKSAKQEEEKKQKEPIEISDTNSSDATDFSEGPSSSRPRRNELKMTRERIMKVASTNKVQVLVQRYEEQAKREKEVERVM